MPAADPTAHWTCGFSESGFPGRAGGIAGAVLHSTADLASGAPARLTNIATHHDWRVSGRRLVYGGHTIGLALAQANPAIAQPGDRPTGNPATTPLRHEGDTSQRAVYAESAQASTQTGVLGLRSLVYAVSDSARSPIGRCSTGVLAPYNSRFGY